MQFILFIWNSVPLECLSKPREEMIHVFAPVHAQLWTAISASPLENVALSIHHEGVKKEKQGKWNERFADFTK